MAVWVSFRVFDLPRATLPGNSQPTYSPRDLLDGARAYGPFMMDMAGPSWGGYVSAVTIVGRMAIAGVTAAASAALGWVAAQAYAVGVSGSSMVPTLVDGDMLVAYPVRRVRPGDVVIARFRARPDLLVVKRAIRPYGDGWWIEGDNSHVTDDSRRYGEAVVLGRVLFRYWRASGSDRVAQ
jgi:Peptidase S24-like